MIEDTPIPNVDQLKCLEKLVVAAAGVGGAIFNGHGSVRGQPFITFSGPDRVLKHLVTVYPYQDAGVIPYSQAIHSDSQIPQGNLTIQPISNRPKVIARSLRPDFQSRQPTGDHQIPDFKFNSEGQ